MEQHEYKIVTEIWGVEIERNGQFLCECVGGDDARRIVAALKLTDHLSLEALESGKFAVGEIAELEECE